MLGARGRGVDGQTCMHDVWGGGEGEGGITCCGARRDFPLREACWGLGGGANDCSE